MRICTIPTRILRFALWPLIVCVAHSIALAQEGRLVTETVHSPALEDNLFGDSPDREILIYLPPGYDEDTDQRYPVVYLLHGYTGNHRMWMGEGYTNSSVNVFSAMNSWLRQGQVKEMILVMPDSHNRLRGSNYVNSVSTGRWADFIAVDLVEHIDNGYRTLPQRESRAVAGHSMGADGALRLGVLYPEVFSSIGGLAGAYDLKGLITKWKEIWAAATTVTDWEHFKSPKLTFPRWKIQAVLSFNAAVSPNPERPPFYGDSPFVYADVEGKEIVRNQEAYNEFLGHDILENLESHTDALLAMKAIYIDCGTSDDLSIEPARKLHGKLASLEIEHVYQEFEGDHTCCISSSTGNALKVFSDAISFEMLSAAGEQPDGN